MSERLPPGIGNAYAFQSLNTLSWTMIQGIPLLLFLKSQGIPAWVLGAATSLMPLMMVLQLPAARFAARIGYRRFVVQGWTWRTGFVAGIAATAWVSPWLGTTTTIALVLAQLAAYTALRGIATCGFLPWYSQIVPAGLRGRFLAWDSFTMNATVIVSLLGCSFFLTRWHDAHAYALLFLWSFLTGAGALIFLRRIPNCPAEPETENSTPVPWREILVHRPFLLLMACNALMNAALAGAGVLWVTLLRDRFQVSDAEIAFLPVISASANATVTFVIGPILDRTGSRPVLQVAATVFAGHLLLWWALAAGLLPYGWGTLLAIQISAGLWSALFGIANTRLLMGVVPGQGRAHFFAIHNVGVAVVLGLLPVLWGASIDLLHQLSVPRFGCTWNAWSILYPITALLALAALWPLLRMPEAKSLSSSEFLHEFLVRSPRRALARLADWVTPR